MRGRTKWALRMLALALVALGLGTCALVALRQPLALGDFTAIWGLKAKALYRTGEIASLFRVDPEGAFSHPEYPPLWPIVLAAWASFARRWDELLLTPLWPLLCLGGALFAARAARGALEVKLFAAAAVSLLPYFRRYPGYAEALLLVFVAAAVAEIDRLSTERGAPIRLALFFTLAAWTKPEGALAALVAAAILFGAGRRRPALLTALSVFFFALVPWASVVAMHGGAKGAFALSSFSSAKVAAAAAELVRDAGPYAAWLFGAAALFAMAPGTWKRRRAGVLAAALYLGLLFGSFAFSRFDPAWHLAWSWDRLAFVPVAIVIPWLCEAAAEAGDTGDTGDTVHRAQAAA